jgi:hypothetical protein
MITKYDLYKAIIVSAAVLSITACATIVGNKTQLMNIASNPSEADINIADEKGQAIFQGKTPTNVTLQKSDGSYWGKKSYTVTVAKPGYAAQTIPVTASANGWYIAGNFVFGGLIGWFIVDPFNGAMYTLAPQDISATLGDNKGDNKTSNNNRFKDGNIRIVLLEDVPGALRDRMVKVGE